MKLRPKDLLKDLTWMQIGAGALAAATSFLLSSSIGIAGSLIGAAVGSVVTTFSSAIYKSLFTASDEAIKKKIGVEVETDVPAEKGALTNASGAAGASPYASTSPYAGVPSGADASPYADPSPYARGAGKAGVPVVAEGSAPVSSSRERELRRVRALSSQRKARRAERLVVGISLVTGIVAVGVSAAVVLGATGGDGIGYRPAAPAPFLEVPTTTQVETDAGAEGAQQATPVAADEAAGTDAVPGAPTEGGAAAGAANPGTGVAEGEGPMAPAAGDGAEATTDANAAGAGGETGLGAGSDTGASAGVGADDGIEAGADTGVGAEADAGNPNAPGVTDTGKAAGAGDPDPANQTAN